MVQLQLLNKVLQTKDISIITENNLTSEYFLEYEDEFLFLQNHYETYKVTPDIETFISKFPEFEQLIVNETDRYFIDTFMFLL